MLSPAFCCGEYAGACSAHLSRLASLKMQARAQGWVIHHGTRLPVPNSLNQYLARK
jgi:hypothetical protein